MHSRDLRPQRVVTAAQSFYGLISSRGINPKFFHHWTHHPIGPASEADSLIHAHAESYCMAVSSTEVPLRLTQCSTEMHCSFIL